MKLKIKVLTNLTTHFGDKIQVDIELPDFPDMGVKGVLVPIPANTTVLTANNLLAIRTQIIVAAKKMKESALIMKAIEKQLIDADLSTFEIEA